MEGFDLDKFFTRDNEEKGQFYEPSFLGAKSGLKFLIYGPNSSKSIVANAAFYKEMDEIAIIDDEEERAAKISEAQTRKLCKTIGKVEHSDGTPLTISGKLFEKEDLYNFLIQAPIIQESLFNYQAKAENFLDREKNG